MMEVKDTNLDSIITRLLTVKLDIIDYKEYQEKLLTNADENMILYKAYEEIKNISLNRIIDISTLLIDYKEKVTKKLSEKDEKDFTELLEKINKEHKYGVKISNTDYYNGLIATHDIDSNVPLFFYDLEKAIIINDEVVAAPIDTLTLRYPVAQIFIYVVNHANFILNNAYNQTMTAVKDAMTADEFYNAFLLITTSVDGILKETDIMRNENPEDFKMFKHIIRKHSNLVESEDE